MRWPLYRLALAFIIALVTVMGYLGFFAVMRAPQLQASALNPRLALWQKAADRGGIEDRNGEILAETVNGRRLYPWGRAAAPVTGYLAERYGYAGVEAAANDWLAGLTGREGLRNKLRRLAGRRAKGYDVILTLDMALQAKAMTLLGERRGAVVVLEPQTARVLALASTPSFDPEEIERRWPQLSRDPDAPLFNRALNGLYPPGSVAKLLTAAAALETDPAARQRQFSCPGYLEIGGRRLRCTRAHGVVNLQEALVHSCNTAVGRLALTLNTQDFGRAAAAWGFGRPVPFDLPTAASSFPLGRLEANGLVEAAIGQGKVMMTPLHVAWLTAAVANGGRAAAPRLVAAVRDSSGRVVALPQKTARLEPFPPAVARFLGESMAAAVARGTARLAAMPGVPVAGKTGTAENPHGPPHAWFTGFAPVAAPQVVVTVVVENAGSGGEVAAPLARELFLAALAGQGNERVR